ncbi:MAG: site-specific DNA-methyltransferase [Verrucomicrobiota bacterium]|nr:site-specific DNA-methyltransferase [Verrucomicrobiota bacterium]
MTEFDLRLGDCVTGMATLAAESIDLVVTSPPYNLGIRYGKYVDTGGREVYLDWCEEWAAQVKRLLRPDGSLFLNVGAAPSNPMLPHELVLRLRKFFLLQNTIHWVKSIALPNEAGEEVSRGHFKPINSPRYLNDCHEYVFHLTPDGKTPLDRLALGVPYQDKSNVARWGHTGGHDRRCRGNTWFVPYETIQRRAKERPHPATFPVQLAMNCIRLHGLTRVDRMLDPFLGIGNSAVAARQCGLTSFVGFEIDEEYLAEARRRLG